MPTLDDRNKPIDPYNTRKSIDECSGEEWDSASRAYWAKTAIDKQLYEEDPVYSREDKIIHNWLHDQEEEDLFGGSLFTDTFRKDRSICGEEETAQLIEEEDAFEDIVKIIGPWEAISFCHGTALAILMDKDNFTNSASIEKAKTYLSRMARLINETKECNW